jgi:hypothetical protein
MRKTPIIRSLEIYVAESCFGCDRARELASRIEGWNLTNLTVFLRELGDPETIRPDTVFAVPTYLLDGRVISLGNPDETRLYALLRTPIDDST